MVYLVAAASGCARALRRKEPAPPAPPRYPIDAERSDRAPDPSRVGDLEGVDMDDFERSLPDLPGRGEVLQKLQGIIMQ